MAKEKYVIVDFPLTGTKDNPQTITFESLQSYNGDIPSSFTDTPMVLIKASMVNGIEPYIIPNSITTSQFKAALSEIMDLDLDSVNVNITVIGE